MTDIPTFGYEYQVGGSLPVDAPTYVRRQADTDLYQALRAGQFCYVLNCRQMGKSSLRVQVMQRLQQQGVVCAAIDLTAIGTADVTAEQWYVGMINRIVRPLRLHRQFDLNQWWAERGLLSYVQRFSLFIEEVLLELIPENIAIFIDEIDSVLSLSFSLDDFFALIRECYNRRADHPAYRRLTFTLLGVTTPADLMRDRQRTPFNIGQPIDLTGFTLTEAQTLAAGLEAKSSQPQTLLRAVLDWTGGQPFLTQKLCRLILAADSAPEPGQETAWVAEVVQQGIIHNWESQDIPQHLRTIRDRLIYGGEKTGRLLGLYQAILQRGEVPGDDSPEQVDLRLTGLVVNRDGRLRVYNQIYQRVFNRDWLERSLSELRPYGGAIAAWLASNQQDSLQLLRGQELARARAWARDKGLSDDDRRFLDASQELEMETQLAIERQANQILTQARQQAETELAEASQRLLTVQQQAETELAEASQRLLTVQQQAETELAEASQRLLTVQQQAETELAEASQRLVTVQEQVEQSRAEAALVKRRANRRNRVSFVGAAMALTIAAIAVPRAIVAKNAVAEANRVRSQALQENQRLNADNSNLNATLQGTQDRVKKAEDREKAAIAKEKDAITKQQAAENQSQKAQQQVQRAQQQLQQVNQLKTQAEQQTATVQAALQRAITEEKRVQGDLRTAQQTTRIAQQATTLARQATQLEQQGSNALRLFETNPVAGLLMALQAGQGLQTQVKQLTDQAKTQGRPLINHHLPLTDYPAVSPITALGQILRDIQGRPVPTRQGWVRSVSWSGDGQTLATGGSDGTVKLWRPDGTPLHTLEAQQGSVLSVSWSGDGQTLATGGDDGTVKLWRPDGTPLHTLEAQQGSVLSVSWSGDGQTLATGGSDGTVKLWRPDGTPLHTLE
ncbi:MAG: AAA-like domain-containing protein, partial [Nodosilinea sp.]